MKNVLIFTAALGVLVSASAGAMAQDKLKVAVGQRGVYENSISELGQNAGFFKKHGLELEVLYTQGSGETQQAVISGSVDIGIGVGTHGLMGAFSKGAPVRAIGATMTGAYEFWYVKADSPIKSFKDAAGKTVAYSTSGSSTQMMVNAMQKQFDVKVRPTATGSPTSTFTQVMSNQIDVGWSAPPLAYAPVLDGRTRILVPGKDITAFRSQTIRMIAANAGDLEKRRDVYGRYLAAYRDTIEWMYSDPSSLDAYAKWAEISREMAEKVRNEFLPKANLDPGRMSGLDEMMEDAVSFKFLAAKLTKEQFATLFQKPDVKK
ncbi:MAG: ABC transporter substrate-binding protein [Beijerinckiaceae bacterium]|nr:ABC transporter substrate-binding protein [Beijerinckiaceae bacterium]